MHILVVDDEEDVKTLFEQRFRKEAKAGELQMSFAYSGNEALQILQQRAQDIFLVLSDINMPGMNGFELVDRIHRDYSSKKIMMISAYGDDENLRKARSCGVDAFMTKPIDFNELKEKMKTLLN